jgi:flavin-dependent dehydrogenase
MYFSHEKKKWIFPVNNFSVNYRGTYREFYGCHFITPNAEDRLEIGDYEANASGQGIPAVVFYKGALLGGLFEEGQKAGVSYFRERNVIDARKTAHGVEVLTTAGEQFTGTFCIAADGANSRLARKRGLNRDRIFCNTGKAISYYITGVKFERSEVIFLGVCPDPSGRGAFPFSMLPSVYRDDEYWLYIPSQERFEFFTQSSPFKKWFRNVQVTHKRCAVINNWSPAKEPFKDNVLFVGDTCWFAEAENTGALLSGHKATNAVCKALHTGKANREGVMEYIDWWKCNRVETHDYKEFLCYPVFNRMFTEDEHNYLHHIVTQKLPWTMNPFKLYERVMIGIKPHLEKIKQERPALAKKIAMFRPETAVTMMKPASRAGFSNY